jgi:ketosteroid isomerase-like protein
VSDNVEAVRAILTHWEQGRFDGLRDAFTPDLVFETFMPDAERLVARGFEESESFALEWFAQWHRYRIVADEYREAGPETVFVSARQMGVGRHGGVEVDSPGFCVFTLREGKVARLSLHYDRAKALEEAGLAD